MIQSYNLSQRLLAYILILSLFLQSCRNVRNQLKSIAHEAKLDSPGSSKQNGIQQLIEQDFTIEKRYIVAFYEDDEILKADVKVSALQ